MTEKIKQISPTLTDMEVGAEVKFPLLQLRSVRVVASTLGTQYARKYQTRVDKEARTITVIRTA